MGKRPSFQFYPGDWSRDLEEYPLEIQGAWIRLICKLWWAPFRGKWEKTLIQWAKILQVPKDKAREIISILKEERIGDIALPGGLSLDDIDDSAKIEIACRRMVREEEARRDTADRVRNHRKGKETSNAPCNAPVTGDVTPTKQECNATSNAPVTDLKRRCNAYSSSSSSSSSSLINDDDIGETENPLPYSEILNRYHTILPEFPKIRDNRNAKKHVSARWHERKERQNLQWWEGFFREIRTREYLMQELKPNLEWICRPNNFAKIQNGEYRKVFGKRPVSDGNRQAAESFIGGGFRG